LKLFGAEQNRVLTSFYGAEDADAYGTILSSLSTVLEDRIVPQSLALDQGKGRIDEPRRLLFDQGLGKLPHASEAGGMGVPFGVYGLAMELVGAADASVAMSLGIHNTVADAVATLGSVEQKRVLLPALLSGDKLAAFALTEPASGSDARSMKTRAARDGHGWVIDGSKMYITNAGEADVYLVFAATETGHCAFLIEASNPGLRVGRNMQEKLGMRGSRTAEVTLEGCLVGEGSVLGAEGAAFSNAKRLLDSSRVVMGMICVGIAETAHAKGLSYSKERNVFGGKLSDLQLTREKLAEASIDMSAARLLCMHAARMKEGGFPFSSDAARGKVFATEMAAKVCDATIQLLGGYGYTSDDVHRHWRDARLLTIGEGTSEVLRLLIASAELGLGPG
jgi:alkylation response protein AidB-like acyl-CoA dehydrogenase